MLRRTRAGLDAERMTDGLHPPVGTVGGALERRASLADPGSRPCMALMLGCVMISGGCFGHMVSTQDEQRSTAEYDLANDARANGRQREALSHVQKSLKLNPDNPD